MGVGISLVQLQKKKILVFCFLTSVASVPVTEAGVSVTLHRNTNRMNYRFVKGESKENICKWVSVYPGSFCLL
jgi:hypothetical protein